MSAVSPLSGAHVIIASRDSAADRTFLRDVLKLPSVDAGRGWLIFGLPPSEVAVHPAKRNGTHELYFMCDDVTAFITLMQKRRIKCAKPIDAGWGILSRITLPGGGTIGVYEPRHPRPKPATVRKARRK